ncbi:MAG: D-alanine--D-alanine ligase [Candidatus Omnitrophica bacterium]|nr:D-alanine--D-alanine ligase [Candidatus Omnitrophota bacterium]MCB9720844.1 D-alanine--D-alanine ligase [Candidatus Omnitrophota bacterium]
MSQNKHKFGRIGVLMGGCSSEREISLQSGQAVYDALHGMGLDVQAIDLRDDQPDRVRDLLLEKKVDGVFIALHGRFGEDGQIQKLCEQLGLPYTGSDAVASRRAYNKIITQSTLLAHNVMVPDFVTMESQDPDRIPATVASLGSYPFVVKPACEGSSIGVTVVRDETELRRAVEEAWGYGPYVLIERFVPGRELTVGILGDVPLDAVEVVTQRPFYDFTAKYQEGQTEYKVPADLPLEIRHVLQETAFKVHTVMGCRDISRVDFRLDPELKPFVLEINTIPGFTPHSLLPKAAAHAQITFDKICLTLLNLAYAQKKEKKLITADH